MESNTSLESNTSAPQMESKPLASEHGLLDLELEHGLREICSLIQRKVIDPANARKDAQGVETPEMRLQHALVNCPAAWAPNIGKVLYTTSEIEQRVKQLALQISKDYEGKELVVVGILTGAICFMTDLLKHLLIPYKLDFMMLSSYGSGSKSSGVVMLKKDLARDPSGQHILIVEDLIDTGNTLKWLKHYLLTKRCASVRLCTLLDKKARREHGDVTVDYVGWVCPDEFVVGYGMDYAEDYRCLPFVGALRPEAYMPKEKK